MSKCGRLATRWTLLGVVLLCVVIVTWIGFCGLDQEEGGDSIERQSLSGLKLDIPPDHESRGGEDTQEMFSDSGAAGNRPAGVTGRVETGDLHAAGEQAILDCDREKDNDLREEDLRSVGDATHLLNLHSLNSKDLGIEKRTQVQVAVHVSFKRINMPWDRGKAFKEMGALKERLEHAEKKLAEFFPPSSRIDCRGLFSSSRNSSRTPPQSRIPDRSRPRSRTPDRSRPSPRQFPSSPPAPRTGSPYPVDQARASVSASGGGTTERNAEGKDADQDPRFAFVSTISGGYASADNINAAARGEDEDFEDRPPGAGLGHDSGWNTGHGILHGTEFFQGGSPGGCVIDQGASEQCLHGCRCRRLAYDAVYVYGSRNLPGSRASMALCTSTISVT